jgi:hypothetical protein
MPNPNSDFACRVCVRFACQGLNCQPYIGMTNPIHTRITIPLKNEWNSYSLWNGMDFSKKKPFIICYFFILFSAFSHPPNNAYLSRSNLVFVLSLSFTIGSSISGKGLRRQPSCESSATWASPTLSCAPTPSST